MEVPLTGQNVAVSSPPVNNDGPLHAARIRAGVLIRLLFLSIYHQLKVHSLVQSPHLRPGCPEWPLIYFLHGFGWGEIHLAAQR